MAKPVRLGAVQRQRHWHALRAEDAVAAVESEARRGLTADEAARRLERFGPNSLPEPRRRSALWLFLRQVKNPLVYLLFIASGISLALGHASDAAVILVVVLLNTLIGALQEGRAERSLAALRKLAGQTARVIRDGSETLVEARDVVPGDILVLEAGDAVAADARLLHGAALQIAEAPLTGESSPVSKHLLPLAPDTPLTDRRNMVYAGTHVTAGRARVLVVATGLGTEMGRIATLAEAAEEPPTPLERRMTEFGRYAVAVALLVISLVVAVGLLRGLPLGQVLLVGMSQLVSLIPEGLPVAMTVALAVGVQRMARRRAIVRRLAAVETLGCTTVICSDKTGTLTRNEMTATAIYLPAGVELEVTGTGYAPQGRFFENGREVGVERERELRALLEAGALCNDAQLEGPRAEEPRWKAIGDPTEAALVSLAVKAGIVVSELRDSCPRRAEIPFDPSAKLMATQHETPAGRRVFVKGAPELVLELCRALRVDGRDVPLDAGSRSAVHEAAERMAARALRLLAVAVVDDAEIGGERGFDAFRGRATLLGLIGQIDPPRPEVQQALERCREAGVRAVMVTGDHEATGRAVASALGLVRDGDAVIGGRELARMTDAELDRRIDRIAVFARVHPAQKLRIVEAYQRRGEVVTMTGDGVNDAPALVRADVGVAMGLTGTEVAKEAAKVVIGDDNFATIVAAVAEGRVVYRNVQKALLLLLSTSAAEVVILLLAMILGYPPPFAAVQILWNNFVTEGVITVNLMMEPAEGDEMRHRPIAAGEPLVTRALLARLALLAASIVVATLGWFVARTSAGVPEAQARTETFTLLAICEWFNVLNCRSARRSALNLGLLENRWLLGGLVLGNLLQAAVVFWAPLGRLFHTVPFDLDVVVALGLVGSLVLWVEEARKLVVRRRERHSG